MRYRTLSVREPHISNIESGRKTIEVRTRPIALGPLVLVCSATGGSRAEVRVLVDVVECREVDGDDAEAALCEFEDLHVNPPYYGYFLANVRPLRRDLVRHACINCARGIRDTHAGIFHTDVALRGENAGKVAFKPISFTVAPRAPLPLPVPLPVRRPPVQLIRPPAPSAAAGAALLVTHKATPPTALRQIDPFSITAHRTLLEEAIAEFGDTAEVRELFGK